MKNNKGHEKPIDVVRTPSREEMQSLLHELATHQLELEMQNEELRTAEARYRELFNNNHALVLLVDPQTGMIVDANPAAKTFYGYQDHTMIGTLITQIDTLPETEVMAALQRSQFVKSERFHARHHTKGCDTREVEIFSSLITVNNKPHLHYIIHDLANELQLRSLYGELQSEREEERTRIAREIHDELGQVLTAIKIDIAWLKKTYAGHEDIIKKASATLEMVDAAIKSIKKICADLRPDLLDHLGLGSAIQWLGEEFEKKTGIVCEINVQEGVAMDSRLATALFRIFQESLTNVQRYADASMVTVVFKKNNANLVLKIKDNGKGISAENMVKPNSFGLLGMRERLYPWKGRVRIIGSPGEGTKIEVTVPILSQQD